MLNGLLNFATSLSKGITPRKLRILQLCFIDVAHTFVRIYYAARHVDRSGDIR